MREMSKYSKKTVEKICRLISSDSYTISEVCENVGISRQSFYKWKTDKPEFSKAVEEAEEQFNEMIVVEAKRSLMRMIRGYTVQEKKTVSVDTGKKDDEGKPIVKIKEHSVYDKHVQPSIVAAIFALANRDPDNWKNRMSNEVTAEVSVKSDLEKLSDEELQAIIDGD